MAHGVTTLETRNWDFKNDVRVRGHLDRNSDRVYLEEFFIQRPGINADIDQVYTTEVARACNKNFETLGTNATTALVTHSVTEGGITLTTAGADNDQIIILPHLDTGVTAWATYTWGTENQVIWEATIRTGASIATLLVWAGLKLTNTPTVATDADQVFFRYSTDDSDTTWQVESSIADSDTSTSTSVTVAVSTITKFKIAIDSDRKAWCYIDNNLVYVTAALTNDVSFIPYVGIQSLAGAADNITLCYEKISRVIFE